MGTPRVTNNFDLIRLLAALQVVISHGNLYLRSGLDGPLMNLAGYVPGVPIFFVVSGFLISLTWERTPDVRYYARNRGLRIYPALWVCLLVTIVTIFVEGVRPESGARFGAWVAAQSTLFQFYNPSFLRSYGIGVINGSLWTIPVELQFYAVLPVLAHVARARPAAWVAIAVAALAVMLVIRTGLFAAGTLPQKLLEVSILPYLFYFVLGVLARYGYERRSGLFVGKGILWAGAYALWVLAEVRWNISGSTGNQLNIISLALLAMLVISLAFTMPGLASRVLRGNDVSYGLYIYHAVVVNVFVAHAFVGRAALAWFLMISLALAWLSWRLVERPALSLKRRSLRAAAVDGPSVNAA